MGNLSIISFLNNAIKLILNPLIELAFAVATVYFLYGIVKYLTLDAADNKRVEARNAIIWGIVGMVVMFSVYGLIRFVLLTFGITGGDVGPNTSQFIKF